MSPNYVVVNSLSRVTLREEGHRAWPGVSVLAFGCSKCPFRSCPSHSFPLRAAFVSLSWVVGALQDDVRVARQGHAAVVHHGKALVLGGVAEGTVFMNDCLA